MPVCQLFLFLFPNPGFCTKSFLFLSWTKNCAPAQLYKIHLGIGDLYKSFVFPKHWTLWDSVHFYKKKFIRNFLPVAQVW